MQRRGAVAYAQRVARLKPALRLLVIGLVSALVISLVAFIGAVVTVRRSLPERSGELTMTGLKQEVRVYRDDRGIPQIYAQNDADLMRAQGFVHAQDRLFEMDLRRHATSGRLAELLGGNEAALKSDRVVRTLGWRRVAEAEFPRLAPETRNLLQAYSDGVNAYMRGKSSAEMSVEYTLLDLRLPKYRIEAWTPVDSLAWLKAMAWDLKANYDDELTRARLAATLPVRRIEQLYPKYRPAENAPILSAAELTVEPKSATGSPAAKIANPVAAQNPPPAELAPVLNSTAGEEVLTAAQSVLQGIPELVGRGAGVGSNSWVLSGKHTATGKPLMANDPHLEPSLPGVWYQIGLHCVAVTPECTFGVSGFSFAGLPGVVIGHNDRVSWGLTNLGADVTDLFLERIVGGRVEYDGEYEDLDQRPEVIKVRGGRERSIVVRSTRHGPLISDVSPPAQDAGRDVTGDPSDVTYDAALSWTALRPGRAADGLFAINRATNWTSFRKGAQLFGEPAQNMIYADTDGNIGYQTPGRIPIRTGFDGRWPIPGWLSKYSWKGFVEFEDLPAVLNPEDGIIITANQAVSPAASPFLTQDWEPGYRAQRIADALADSTRMTVAQAQKLQLDTENP
ncbi:MAG: penicillin acylase family protein, partial [Angustibacter sp.]